MSDNYTGSFLRGSSGSEYATIDFIVRRILGRSATSGMVQVKAVHPGTGSVGFVDVQPMVHQIDGQGNVTPHEIVYGLPYFRLQGGVCAIIIDPAVGDIGAACYASEDISSVKNNRAPSNPGSRRRFSMSDGIYFGGHLNATPTQYVQLDPEGGITITSAAGKPVTINAPGGCTINTDTATITASDSITLDSPTVHATGDITCDGTLTADTVVGTTDVQAGGKSGAHHTHGGVSTGSGTSGEPS